MDIEKALEFFRENHHAVLVTKKADGSPQPSPVVAGVDDHGRIVISTRETAYKVRNLRRDPRSSICGLRDQFFGQWVAVEGNASIISLPEAMDQLVELYRRISGEHPDWDDYREAMRRERRVILAITPERAGPDRSG